MNEPVFLLSCGPRTGSTWLQRCLIKNGIMVWGERVLIEFLHLMDSQYVAKAYATDIDWNLQHFLCKPLARRNNKGELVSCPASRDEMWTAVLNPPILPSVLRSICEEYFACAARDFGYPAWGVKETMWQPHYVERLRAAYPECKMLFLARQFLPAYHSRFGQSYSPPAWGEPEIDWSVPSFPMAEDAAETTDKHLFCRRWCNLTAKALVTVKSETAQRHRLVRYEDILPTSDGMPSAFCDVLSWCGCETFAPSQGKIGASPYRDLENEDRFIISRYLDDINAINKRLGYEEIIL